MSHLIRVINGKAPSAGVGGVSDADLSNFVVNFLNAGIVDTNHYKIEEQGTPNMTVKVNTGKAYVPNGSLSMMYSTELDATVNGTITNNSSGNPRIDAVVIKLDLGVTPNNFANNVATIVVVAGAPAASPSAPLDADIQTAVGAGNPFYRLANVTVANGAVSITNANIADTRSLVTLKDTISTKRGSASVYNSGNQSIPDTTETVLTFDTEEFDTDAIHSTSSNTGRLTIPAGQDGKWLIIGQVQMAANANGSRYLKIRKNGSTVLARSGRQPDGSFTTNYQIERVVSLVAGDYVELLAYHSSGGALNAEAGLGATFFQCHRLS